MATLFLVSNCNPISHSFPFASLRVPHFPNPPALRFSSASHQKPRGSTVAARAGPSANSIAFAIALPLSLLAVTVFTSIRIADKLDQDFLEEMAMNEAIMEADADDDDEVEEEEDMETYLQEPALPRARNRPKREAEAQFQDELTSVDRSADL